jgi:single-strand DNA-binding protein
MASLNHVILIGNLGTDPVMRVIPSGKKVVEFSIATSEKWKGADGNYKEETTWHKIVVWDQLAENCNKYLSKGKSVNVIGKIKTEKYNDKDGVERYITKINASSVVFLSPADDKGGASRSEQESPATVQQDDDIPF